MSDLSEISVSEFKGQGMCNVQTVLMHMNSITLYHAEFATVRVFVCHYLPIRCICGGSIVIGGLVMFNILRHIFRTIASVTVLVSLKPRETHVNTRQLLHILGNFSYGTGAKRTQERFV